MVKRLASGVLRDEVHHRLRVAGDDDDEVLPVVLHLLDERVDGLLRGLVPGEAVGLVDEEHAADRLGADLGRLHRRLPDVPGDELQASTSTGWPWGSSPSAL